MTKFIFDLDGTVTMQETLPLISKHFNIQEAIDNIKKETIQANILFVESFIKRINIHCEMTGREIIDEILRCDV